MDKTIRLVPDRWTYGGWKYVRKEPTEMPYFNSTNRTNSFGAEYRGTHQRSLEETRKKSSSPRGYTQIEKQIAEGPMIDK